LAMRRARRSPHLRPPPPSRYRDQELPF
jgi:hypothetical protein